MKKLLRAAFLLVLTTAFFGAGVEGVLADSIINISSITATPDDAGFTVQWTTAVPASSIVTYGTTSSYGTSTPETDTATRVTEHSVSVTGLAACTTYHYQVTSNTLSYAETTASSADQQVTTAGCADVAQATPDSAPLVDTGDANTVYLTGIVSLLMIILAISQLRKQG